MIREKAIELMRGAACSKTITSLLSITLTQAQALKLVRHYVKACPKGKELGNMITQRVLTVTASKRRH